MGRQPKKIEKQSQENITHPHLKNEDQIRHIHEISIQIKENLKPSISEPDVAKLIGKIDQLRYQYISKLEDKPVVDNSLIIDYFDCILELTTIYRTDIYRTEFHSKGSRDLFKSLQKIIELCNRAKEYFKYAMHINIYKLEVPQCEYKKLETHLKKFFYFGRSQPLKSLAVGAPLYLIGFVASFIGVFIPGRRVEEALGSIIESGTHTLDGAFRHYGLACKYNLLAGSITDSNKIDWLSLKPIYHPQTREVKFAEADFNSEVEVLYLLDCQETKAFVQHGTNLLLSNNKGHTILFDSLNSAIEFAKMHGHGKSFDSLGGWRIDGMNWTLEERQNLRQWASDINQYTSLPINLNNIVMEYFASEELIIKNILKPS